MPTTLLPSATRRCSVTADGKVFTKGFSDQTGDLWSRDGRLLATSHQIVYFRAD